MDQIFCMDEHVIQSVTLAASFIMLVIALLTEVFIGRINQSVYTAMIRHFTTAAGVYLNNKKQPCYHITDLPQIHVTTYLVFSFEIEFSGFQNIKNFCFLGIKLNISADVLNNTR